MEFFFSDFSGMQIVFLMLSAVLIGINKTGIPGLGLIPVVMLALTFDTKISTGLQLVMLCTADLAAVAWYRRSANWKIVMRLIPAALTGIAGGHFLIHQLNDRTMQLTIGIIVILLGIVTIIREAWLKDAAKIPSHWAFALLVGFFAGFSTQVANAAGPIMALYLIAMRLPKEEYMGTAAWYFMILNWLKLPIFAMEGRVTLLSLKADLAMLPFIAIGAALGIIMLNRMPKKFFNRLVLVLSMAAAVWMVVKAVMR